MWKNVVAIYVSKHFMNMNAYVPVMFYIQTFRPPIQVGFLRTMFYNKNRHKN